jgi:hypothetical protein
MTLTTSAAVVTGKEYLTLPRAPDTWLLEPLLPAGGTMVLYGDPKIGKSYAGIQLSLSLQGGGDWLGFPVTKTGSVLYIQLDTPRSLWADRLSQLRANGLLGVDQLLLADRDTLGTWPFNILLPDHWNLLRACVDQHQPDCVIVDTLRDVHEEEENSSTTMKVVMSRLVAATQPAALIVISHAKKPNPEAHPDLLGDVRGSGYIVAGVDAIARMTKTGLYYTGRAIEQGVVKIQREDNGLWSLEPTHGGDETTAIEEVLSDPELVTTRARARMLALKLGKTEEAARSILRRTEVKARVADPPLDPPSETHLSD